MSTERNDGSENEEESLKMLRGVLKDFRLKEKGRRQRRQFIADSR